jgi:hypothetical protein
MLLFFNFACIIYLNTLCFLQYSQMSDSVEVFK